MLDALCPDKYLNNPRTCCSVVLYWYSVVLHKDKSCDVHMAYDLLMINIRYSFMFFCKQSPSSQSEHSSQHRQCNCTWGNASILWILFSGADHSNRSQISHATQPTPCQTQNWRDFNRIYFFFLKSYSNLMNNSNKVIHTY